MRERAYLERVLGRVVPLARRRPLKFVAHRQQAQEHLLQEVARELDKVEVRGVGEHCINKYHISKTTINISLTRPGRDMSESRNRNVLRKGEAVPEGMIRRFLGGKTPKRFLAELKMSKRTPERKRTKSKALCCYIRP